MTRTTGGASSPWFRDVPGEVALLQYVQHRSYPTDVSRCQRERLLEGSTACLTQFPPLTGSSKRRSKKKRSSDCTGLRGLRAGVTLMRCFATDSPALTHGQEFRLPVYPQN